MTGWNASNRTLVRLLWAFALIALSGAFAWAFRWETLYAGRDTAYLINRWTGEVRWVVGTDWHQVKDASAPTGPFGSNDPIAK